MFSNPRVSRLCLGFFLFFLAFNGFTAVLVLFFKQKFGWGPGRHHGVFDRGGCGHRGAGGLDWPSGQTLRRAAFNLAGLGLVLVGC